MPQFAKTQSTTHAKDARTNAAPASVEHILDKPGTRLPPDLQREALQRLGFDASSVRVHADADAGASAREMRMRAYAVRPHIVFGPNMYRPETSRGRALALHELGHMAQQAEFVRGQPLGISRSSAHEINANQLWRGESRAPMPMSANVIAGEADTAEETEAERIARQADLREIVAQTRGAIANARGAGTLSDGNTYRIIKGAPGKPETDRVEVTFRPRAEGQVILNDADDPEDLIPADQRGATRKNPPATLPSVLLPNGETAVQRETKRLVAYDTPVVAVYEAKNIQFDRFGNPVEITKYKPIELTANTIGNGRLVQDERNETITGKTAPGTQDIADPRTRQVANTKKEFSGYYNYVKGPKPIDGRNFKKYEDSTLIGEKKESSVTETVDLPAKKRSVQYSEGTFRGIQTAGKGKGDPQDDLDNGLYVIRKDASGKTEERNRRIDEQELAGGRKLQTVTDEEKTSALPVNVKNLGNQGIERKALDQVEEKNKEGTERTKKTVTSTVLRPVDVPQDLEDTKKQYVPVQRSVSRSDTTTKGKSEQRVEEGPDTALRTLLRRNAPKDADINDPKNLQNLNKKDEETRSFGRSGSRPTISSDSGPGVRGFKLQGNPQYGYESSRKNGKAPDIPDASVSPTQGKADIASAKLVDIGTKDGKDPKSLSVTAGLTSAGVSLDAKGTLSHNYEKKDDKQYDPNKAAGGNNKAPSSWLGIFSLETLYGSTSLAAGVLAEGSASARAQRGTTGAARKGAEVGVSLEGSIQAGYYEERRVRYIVKPDINKIPYESAKFLVRAIDPAIDITFNAHAFGGAEAKANLNLRRGGDSQNATGAGASVFVGGRAGLGIDGKLKAGRSLNSDSGSDLGTLKGDVDLTAGVGAAWKTASSVSGGKLMVAGEGALTGLIGGRINAKGEFDLYKFANVGYAVASNLVYSADNRAREAIAQGVHKTSSLVDRIRLLRNLLIGRTDDAEQDAILTVLEDAKSRGDLASLVDNVGFRILRFKLDGKRNDRFHEVVGR